MRTSTVCPARNCRDLSELMRLRELLLVLTVVVLIGQCVPEQEIVITALAGRSRATSWVSVTRVPLTVQPWDTRAFTGSTFGAMVVITGAAGGAAGAG